MGGLPPEHEWIPEAIIWKKKRRFSCNTLDDPDICKNEHITHETRFEKCEYLRLS